MWIDADAVVIDDGVRIEGNQMSRTEQNTSKLTHRGEAKREI